MKRLLVVFPDAHGFANSAHLGSELILNTFKFFKSPSGEFYYHIITGRCIFLKGAVTPVGDFIHGQTTGKHGGNKGNRKTGCLGRQGGRPGSSRVNLDNNNLVCLGIMGELNVCAADNFNCFDNVIRVFLKTLLQLGVNGHHRRSAKRIAGMNTHGIDIFDKANSNHLIFSVSHDFQFKLFPSQDRFFNQNLIYKAFRQTPRSNGAKFFNIIHQTTAGAAHCIGRTNHNRVTQFHSNFFSVFNFVYRLALRHFNAKPLHGFFEGRAIFSSLNSIDSYTDDLHIVFIQNACLRQFR